jgi:ribosomal protein S6--L-glutamate ligase
MENRSDVSGVFLTTNYVTPLISTNFIDTLFASQSLKRARLSGVIPRIGRTQTDFGILCIQQLELMGIPTTLSSNALFIARDKYRCYQTLSNMKEILLPKTLLINVSYQFDKLMTDFKFPVVIKIPDATQGAGSILAPNRRIAQEIVEALLVQNSYPIMIQEYLQRNTKNESNEDIRVIVVGDTILGAMKRIAPKGEWRTNFAQGASCIPYQLDLETKEVVLKLTNKIGIGVAGVDLFPTKNGMYLLEVNACPGWKAFETVFPHISVSENIVDYIISKIRC